ncbi:hypothetical protein J7T55_000016 [Diaporthe amygdali]|uniref:uncharacterized protein n=1 Tax=Phomopsis amygdali TaxID=1214568 RepID=UPI0022FE66B6|nr:uncharacterized protein J7T55_000016 [Diaporthe amygdali]KAJ0107754.1 hypothetical protein J7T55_000016 [Diaporthe amygdali]
MASYGGGGGGDGSLNSLLAQLQRQHSHHSQQSSGNENIDPSAASQYQQHQQQQHQQPYGYDLRSQFNPYNSSQQAPQYHHHHQQQHVDETLPSQDSTDYNPPAAPTPPAGAMYASQHPPGFAARPIEGGDDRTSSLLSLLKLNSGSGGQQGLSQQQQQPQHQPSEQLHRESLIRHASNQQPSTIHAPAPSSADPTGLLAALMRGKFQDDETRSEHSPKPQPQEPATETTWNTAPPPENTQQYLLNLLNRPKPSQSDARPEPRAPSDADHSAKIASPASEKSNKQDIATLERVLSDSSHRGGSGPAVPSADSFEFVSQDAVLPPQLKFKPSPAPAQSSRDGTPPTKSGIFNYTNPFDELTASVSPHNRANRKSTTPGASASPSIQGQAPGLVQILKKPGSAGGPEHKRLSSSNSHLEGRESVRRKVDASSAQDHHGEPSFPDREPEAKPKETVAEAVSDIANQADLQAREAISRAEDEQAQARITQDLKELMAAQTDKEFDKAAAHAASDIKDELEKEQNRDALEDAFRPELAKVVRDIIDDAAQGPVADSWESAEAEDEIVVIEETTSPVKVFNFPMKPWISISIQEGANDTRPVFRDEAILDIARLKKEFDQIDRNLVAASEAYLAYGMSKAGGLRVIRQDDGRDAKLFADTKDRIFNLAISSTPADQDITQKEAIVGTGISGTVYWVQVRDGEKDHLDDAHLEQYGFALPPSSAQEGGDAPGGVLKTRARTSTNHPEYFAVGRGKSINIIWPSFVLQRNLIKPGHDRVVDTDRLAKECSLKINTGKAGKDFTFSQDDSVVVSLDKSGRVKFWDVRDLTAPDEESDPRNPMPAHTSAEVKEPLMTLTTTPEGEKAWPTSVLLLDKLRPYQKRTALRYLIVGMKQNHTLQLWDLALGKPVQEFNLPHSKESDAVCSVMYHPPSGIIVVGHPTRNSVYFLHLSAPKYALKNNPSQVDYIQKLVAQDPSIPTPDSTAVISGMREYSFANKGVLRSLYLLQNPASSSEGAEATLFELYAMHSKGVACLSIKASELGWDEDNKVINPVDATQAGVVTITKLRPPPPQPQNQLPEDAATQPAIRLAVRPKETAAEAAPESSARKVATPPKHKEAKEEETAVPAPAEKPDKKGRKKKAAAEKAAAQAAALADREREAAQTNGHPPKVVATTTHEPAKATKSTPSSSFSQEVDTRINTMEKRLVENIASSFQAGLSGLRQNLDKDAKARDGQFEGSQLKLLGMVSEVLNENCQGVLAKIIEEEMEKSIAPRVGEVVTRTVSAELGNRLGSSVSQSVQKEMQRALPHAMDQALRKPDLVKSMTDKMVHTLSAKIDEQLYAVLDDRIIPRFTKLATEAVTACGKEILVNVNNQFSAIEQVRLKDMQKFDQLVALNTNMSETLNTLVTAQASFQEEILRLQTELVKQQQRKVSPPHSSRSRQIAQESQGPGNGAYHSPSHSQSQALQHVAQAVLPQQHYGSPQNVAQQYSNAAAAAVNSPQQWAPASSIVSPPHQHQQYPNQPVNPSILSLQQSQQFGSPSSQQSNQISGQQQIQQTPQQPQSLAASQLSGSQVVFQPTTKDNRERLDLEQACERVRNYMAQGKFDDAVMTWIQDTRNEEEVFSQVLAKYDATFIQNLNPLLLLTVAATVTANLENPQLLHTKLGWTEVVLVTFFEALPRIEGQVREITPKVMSLLKGRLEHIFLRLSSTVPSDPALRNISTMTNLTQRITDTMRPLTASTSY